MLHTHTQTRPHRPTLAHTHSRAHTHKHTHTNTHTAPPNDLCKPHWSRFTQTDYIYLFIYLSCICALGKSLCDYVRRLYLEDWCGISRVYLRIRCTDPTSGRRRHTGNYLFIFEGECFSKPSLQSLAVWRGFWWRTYQHTGYQRRASPWRPRMSPESRGDVEVVCTLRRLHGKPSRF